MKAIGYVRVSTEEQAREGVSLDNQKNKIAAYCLLKDLELIDTIEDAGISAKNLKRPGVQKVITMAKKKQIEAVVVYKLDRIFRSTVDALETTQMFERRGVAFHSILETIDTKSPMGRFFFTILAGVSELERGVIAERTKAALAHKRAKNEWIGGDVPYGYDLITGGILVKNESEQKVLRFIRHLHRNGYSLRGICRELQKTGYQTKRGNLSWHPATIAGILHKN